MKEPLGASASFEEEDMIERIATALYMSDSGAQGQWEMTNPTRWHRYARSAIEAYIGYMRSRG